MTFCLQCRNREAKGQMTRRLSGDSDSSTASSKGGGGGGGGKRSLGGSSGHSGEDVVLLVNRKEGKHMIERTGSGNQTPPQRPSAPRARSKSQERPSFSPTLKPNLPPGSPDGTLTSRTDRGRSLGYEVHRRLHPPRSHSQTMLSRRTYSSDALSGNTSSSRDVQPSPSGRREDLVPKQVPPSSPRGVVGLTKKQSSSCSNSPIKGVQSNNSSPSKRTITTPRPPDPRSPSTGRARQLPPVTTGGRRSTQPSPRNSYNHATRSPQISQAPCSAGRGQPKNISGRKLQEPNDEGLCFGYQILPPLDPEKEQDLYRSFEAEFLANTQQVTENVISKAPGRATLQVTGIHHRVPALTESTVSDSADSSSNSSTSSVNVGKKTGTLPDLKESRRTNLRRKPQEDPLNVLSGQHLGGSREHWGERKDGLKKLPAISSSVEEKERPSFLSRETDRLMNHIPSQSASHCRNLNGELGSCAPTGELIGQQSQLDSMTENVPLANHLPNSTYILEDDDLLPLKGQSLVPRSPSEDCPFQDSSSENSSTCFSLSESRSDSPPPSLPMTNGENGQKNANDVDSASEHKPGRFKPRTDNRPLNTPSRIPTPFCCKNIHTRETLSPCHTPPLSPKCSHPFKSLQQAFADPPDNKDCSYPAQSSLDTEAVIQN